MQLLGYLLFPQIISEIMVQENLSGKNLHPFLIDSMDGHIEPILEWLLPYLNQLTICTKRPNAFLELQDWAEQNYGLVIELTTETELTGENLIIDLGGGFAEGKLRGKFHGVILDLAPDRKKAMQYREKWSLAAYYYALSVQVREPVSSLDEFLRHLLTTEPCIRRLDSGYLGVSSKELEMVTARERITLLEIKKYKKK